MSKVFIGWSGAGDFAVKLAERIETQSRDKKAGVSCIVGGFLRERRNTLYVPDKVISQMNACDQAIILLKRHPNYYNKDATKNVNIISHNLAFEWGYLIAKLQADKIHNFFIDFSENDKDLPSDTTGMQGYIYKGDPTDEEAMLEAFSVEFWNRHSKQHVEENTMSIIFNRDGTRSKILAHNANAIYTNYEMAQYIISYVYTVNILGESPAGVLKDIEYFEDSVIDPTEELKVALAFAKHTLNFYALRQRKEDAEFISKPDFLSCMGGYRNILKQISTLEDTELRLMLDCFVNNFRNYLLLLVLESNDLTSEERAKYCKRMYDISYETIEKCKVLEGKPHGLNVQIGTLLRAYMYRNKYRALEDLEKLESNGLVPRTESTQDRHAKLNGCLIDSFDARQKLYSEYVNKSGIPVTFKENIEMEYYLAMAECMKYSDDEEEIEEYQGELEGYVKRAHGMLKDKLVFVNRIKGYLSETDTASDIYKCGSKPECANCPNYMG
ncbi:MAG: hypothetical protein E7370_03365 [Clostridiales bacterium]|nr:hypothetical protein [Clostridiales bacterium]